MANLVRPSLRLYVAAGYGKLGAAWRQDCRHYMGA